MTEKEIHPMLLAGRTTIALDAPIVRGDQKITSVEVRKPVAGELRGVALMELAQMDVAALQKVLPRITTPALTALEINNMDPADLTELGMVVAGFLVTKSMREGSSHTA